MMDVINMLDQLHQNDPNSFVMWVWLKHRIPMDVKDWSF